MVGGVLLTLKGSVTLVKLLSRRSRTFDGSFSSIQPTANMLWIWSSENMLW